MDRVLSLSPGANFTWCARESEEDRLLFILRLMKIAHLDCHLRRSLWRWIDSWHRENLGRWDYYGSSGHPSPAKTIEHDAMARKHPNELRIVEGEESECSPTVDRSIRAFCRSRHLTARRRLQWQYSPVSPLSVDSDEQSNTKHRSVAREKHWAIIHISVIRNGYYWFTASTDHDSLLWCSIG